MFKKVSVKSITVPPNRQRKNLGDTGLLADSIRRLGLINPITVTKDFVLIAGERRLAACRILDEDYLIPCRFYEDLDYLSQQLIELEENVKREDLSWQDKALAIKKIHDIYQEQDSDWTGEKTAEALGISPMHVSKSYSVAEQILAGEEKIIAAPHLEAAKNIIDRANERLIDNELNNLIETEREESSESTNEESSIAGACTETLIKEDSFLNQDFIAWAADYSGRRFNFIHCDFPYGIGHDDSEQGGTAKGRFEGYEDSEETYWKLCSVLVDNIDSLMTPTGHVMFWFSMNFYTQTVDFFEKYSDLKLSMPHPLIWYKSDGKGIVSDVNRRPRNVYETALLFSRGDRKILSPVDNCYASPTNKTSTIHVSEKPEPMLRHFFRMFVDSYSEVLDPTAGCGSAIRAADSLGAKRCLGLELNEEFCDEAKALLRRSRNLDKLSKEIEI